MPKHSSPKDRRRFQRLELNITVYYRVQEPLHIKVMLGDKEIEATMLDISVGGMGLLTSFDIPAHTLLLIKFTLSKMDEQGQVSLYGPMEIIGEVRYNILEENKEHRLGIRFKKIDQQDQREIVKFVQMTLSP